MKITIGIKALNEEAHIADALQSAVAAVTPFGGEVVLADSGSTDRTIEIARGFPVRIVQLANRDERCCGAGAQLAFQHARGEYFYMLDGDMVLNPAFVTAGIEYLERNAEVAAVGGVVCERNVEGQGFQIRAAAVAQSAHWQPGIVDRLDCGGLYRASAVREAGFFADRNLHAFEEFDLAARLQARGWKLARIDVPQIDHFGHTTPGYELLLRRLRSGYSGGPGEVLRGAIGQPHLSLVLRKLGHVRNGLAVGAWWAALLATLWIGQPLAFLVLLLAPLLLLSWRRKSFSLGLYSLSAWNVTAWGLITGFFRSRVPPQCPLVSVDLTEASR
jgi:glycosyltransferase involved in cell wall biosynthesis